MYKISNANIKEWAKNYDGELFDGILCDPPYELGFMGKSWDSSGIAFDSEMWADLFKLLKPGAHLLAFSGSRTYHRMACAIEDAGFEIRDMIEWVYGSGFPKSLNIGKAVDKIQGNEREDLGKSENNRDRSKHEYNSVGNVGSNARLTKGTSEWEGYGTALKPAHEPICMARKPLGEKTVAENVLKYGTGGINIDESRVVIPKDDKGGFRNGDYTFNCEATSYKMRDNGDAYRKDQHHLGRFPANLIHDGSDEVEAVFPQTGKGNGKPYSYTDRQYEVAGFIKNNSPEAPSNFNDSGSASRFFYTAKASKSERNAGLEGFEERTTQGMRANAGPALVGEDYIRTQTKNHHPTVKPLSLTKYLATLIKPPTGGRLLVPFSGSGSEMIGALQAGWEYVEGVELTEEYIPIAEARIKYWLEQKEFEQAKPEQVALV